MQIGKTANGSLNYSKPANESKTLKFQRFVLTRSGLTFTAVFNAKDQVFPTRKSKFVTVKFGSATCIHRYKENVEVFQHSLKFNFSTQRRKF